MPVVSAPRLRLRPPNSSRPKPAAAARVSTIRAIERGVSAALPRWGRGGGPSAAPGDPDPPEHRALGDPGGLEPSGERAHRAELGAAEGQGDGDRSGLRALAARQGEFEALVGPQQISERDGRELGAAQRPRKTHQDQRAVAPSGQVVRDRRQQLAKHRQRGGARVLSALAWRASASAVRWAVASVPSGAGIAASVTVSNHARTTSARSPYGASRAGASRAGGSSPVRPYRPGLRVPACWRS
jgi:hypothetical protein